MYQVKPDRNRFLYSLPGELFGGWHIAVLLVPMDATDYQGWLEQAVREYADEKVKSGNWDTSEAVSRSAAEFKNYLPDGPATISQPFCYDHVKAMMKPVGSSLTIPTWDTKINFGYNVSIKGGVLFKYRKMGYALRHITAVEAPFHQRICDCKDGAFYLMNYHFVLTGFQGR